MILLASGLTKLTQTQILVDNQTAIKMAKNEASGARTKHCNIRYHFTGDLVKAETIILTYCPSAELIVHILKKLLGKLLFIENSGNDGRWEIRSLEVKVLGKRTAGKYFPSTS